MAKMKREVECLIFTFLKLPWLQIIMDMDGESTQEKINEMNVYIWKENYELIHKQKA